jgi:hypothetical protein
MLGHKESEDSFTAAVEDEQRGLEPSGSSMQLQFCSRQGSQPYLHKEGKDDHTVAVRVE